MNKVAPTTTREHFPEIEEDIGEDPARFLDENGRDDTKIELALARIRGIDYFENLNAWLAIERRLNGGRRVIVDAIEERREYLEEHGERDVDPEDVAVIREVTAEEEEDEPDPVWRHDPCGSTDVDQESSMAWFCNECEQRTNRVERVDVQEEPELVADGGTEGAVTRDPPDQCPECGGSLARGGLALYCRDCDWRSSIEDTARWLGFDVEEDDEVLVTDGGTSHQFRCASCDAVHDSTGQCEECGDVVREYLPMVGPAWFVEMPSGMPDLLYGEEQFEAAFQSATGVRTEDAGDEHEEEWRVRLMDWDGSMDVPVVHP